jgi:hypothetical protein
VSAPPRGGAPVNGAAAALAEEASAAAGREAASEVAEVRRA